MPCLTRTSLRGAWEAVKHNQSGRHFQVACAKHVFERKSAHKQKRNQPESHNEEVESDVEFLELPQDMQPLPSEVPTGKDQVDEPVMVNITIRSNRPVVGMLAQQDDAPLQDKQHLASNLDGKLRGDSMHQCP